MLMYALAVRRPRRGNIALQFLKASGGEPEFAQGDKTFQLEGEMYAFISVYFVSASDPFVGAYTEICSFSEYMRYYFTFPLVSFVH